MIQEGPVPTAGTPGQMVVPPPRRHRAPRRSEQARTPVHQGVNIGPRLARALVQVGIPDLEALAALGAPTAWQRLGLSHPELATPRVLYALGGAIANVRWMLLSDQQRSALRREAG